MSRLIIKCFEHGAEIISSAADGSGLLQLEFDGEYNGHICIDRISKVISGSGCTLDLHQLEDGCYTPTLVLESRAIHLPPIEKINGVIIPKDYSMCNLRRLSIRDGILADRISRLEKRIKSAEEKVFGSGILGRGRKGNNEEK